MEQLRLKSNQLVSATPTHFSRAIVSEVNWNKARLVGFLGARGIGKTTLLLQQIKNLYSFDSRALYITLDDIYFAGKTLYEFALDFYNRGGEHLFIDEIHKYPNWSQDLKTIYDSLPNLKVAFTGSSTIEMVRHFTNISQRATIHNLSGLSFREYLAMQGIADLPKLELSQIIEEHSNIARELTSNFKPQLHFDKFLTRGYYTFNNENYELYKRELEKVIHLTIESDMAYMDGYDPRNAYKIKQLLNNIAQNVPFKPNLVKISESIGIHRNTLIGYFFHLEKAKLINLVYPSNTIISILQKPELVFMGNPNLAQMLSETNVSRDSLITTFAISQLNNLYPIRQTQQNTLEVDGKYSFAIETSKKTAPKKLKPTNAYALVDGIEIGSEKRIPVWMMGFTY
jgi:predicted AAA+ superfamily ATPase